MNLTGNKIGQSTEGFPIYRVDGRVEIDDLLNLAWELSRYRKQNADDPSMSYSLVDVLCPDDLYLALAERAGRWVSDYGFSLSVVEGSLIGTINDRKPVVLYGPNGVGIGILSAVRKHSTIMMLDPLDIHQHHRTTFVMHPENHAILEGCE